MSTFAPPPTYADPVITDERTGRSQFNPLWLKWFLDIAAFVSASGGGTGGGIAHNSLSGLQGGGTGEMYHFTATEHTALNSGGNTTLHYHASDRNRANHTGTQLLSTISDVTATAAQINTLGSGYTGTITTAKLTTGGTNGSVTFTNGVLTAQTAAT